MAGFVQAVAVDLDGTITRGNVLDSAVLAALDDCRWAGAATILVTGRIEAELAIDFPDLLSHFDAAVLENGAVLAIDDHRTVLASVDPLLAPHLRDRSVPIREGVAILACRSSDAPAAYQCIDDLGLDAQLVHNRNELMVLPAGVSKGTGLHAALSELRISVHNTLAVGDAENDLAMLSAAEIAVAAADSVESVQRIADVVVPDGPGELANFLRGPVVSGAQAVRSVRREMRIGRLDDGSEVTIPGAQAGVLVSGVSGSGKSHLTGLLVERWIDAGYRVLVIDPEGDHSSLADMSQTVVVTADGTLSVDDLVHMLCQQSLSVVLDLSSMTPSVMVPYLETIASGVELARSQYGVPHWVVIDEAHGVLGEDGTLAHIFRPNDGGYCYVTYRPELLCTAAKTTIDVSLTALGQTRDNGAPGESRAIMSVPGRSDREFAPDGRVTSHVRHRNKYRDTALPQRLRFQFRSSTGRVQSTAATIGELIDGLGTVPDETILHHALRGDFSRWALGAVQDRSLGSLLAAVENDCSARVASAVKAFRRHAVAVLGQRYGAVDPDRR